MYFTCHFKINPKLDFDLETVVSLNNKNIDGKLKKQIEKDLVSESFKNDLQDILFNTISNDINDLSQYLSGTISSIKYNKINSSITVYLKLFFSKKIPKTNSKFKKNELLDESQRLKLLTKKNIIEMIKNNINHIYYARGHYKDFNHGKQTIYLDLSQNSKKDKYAIHSFNIH